MVEETEEVIPKEGNDGGAEPPEPGKEGTQEDVTVKIGEKTYNTKELTDYIKKASDYD